MINELSDELHDCYKIDKQRPPEVEWPPHKPSSIVNLALIHYNDRRTQQELIEMSKHFKEGASHVDTLTALHSNVTTYIHKIFLPKDNSEVPKHILIEGAPGIGKTVLAREIAYQWAIGEILEKYKLVFLLYLRDPKLHKVNSVNEILELFTSDNSHDLQNYVMKSHGKNVAFIFDGFDEYPVKLQEDSFITDLIKGVGRGRLFYNSTVIVTSRPTATLFLHDIIDRRIEILGFPKEERDKYISLSLINLPDKKQQLDKYLKQHPIIDNLCYIPLHLAILMYLFQEDSLPGTLTEMNESFIINTIYRYLERNNLTPPGVVKKLQDLPKDIIEFIYKLSKLAFEGLQNNQLVFTIDEIRETCPEVDSIRGAINGFGLLQAVQHYPKEGGAGRITSVNFLHFTMQEYLAAFHVSRLSIAYQLFLIKKIFWDSLFNFMWMMYVGIVGIKSNAFTSFIAQNHNKSHRTRALNGNIYDDKRKCLYLFQCYMEAKSTAEIPREIASIFTDGKIIFNNVTLLPHHISSLIFFMSASSMQQWKILEMQHCNLRDIGMDSLLEHVIKSDEKISTLEYVDLSGNKSSPWGVYCAIIRCCSVDSLTLCGDKGIKEYVKEITNSLQTNTRLQSLTLCKIRQIGLQSIKDVLGNITTLKELNVSWKKKGTKIVNRQLTNGEFNSTSSHTHEGVVNINILYDGDHECSPEVIDMSHKCIDNDAVCLISFGLYSNTIVQKLCLSYNNITSDGAAAIGDFLKYNNTLQELDISSNSITDDGAVIIGDCLKYNNTLKELNLSKNHIGDGVTRMSKLSESFKHAVFLEYIDLSENNSSPWGVYCAIIRYCSVDSLTLCGDEGIDKYTEEIRNSLQLNTTLYSLTLCKIGRNAIHSINVFLDSLKNLNLSWQSNLKRTKLVQLNKSTICNDNKVVNISILYDECLPQAINDKAVCIILFSLTNNTTIERLDLSHGCISSIGMSDLSECFKHAMPLKLQHVDLSGNKSPPWGVYCTIIRHCCVDSLTLCGDEGILYYNNEITDNFQRNTVLHSLILSSSICIVGHYKANSKQSIDQKLYTTLDNINQFKVPLYISNRMMNIKILCNADYECSPGSIIMSNKKVDDDKLCLILFGLYKNTAVKKLDLSHNSISQIGMNRLSECFKCAIPLQYVDLSANKSSPWGVYCTIIRYCNVDSLTLCGNEGIKHFIKKITDSLLKNARLQSLMLYLSESKSSKCKDKLIIKNSRNNLIIYDKLFYNTLVRSDEGIRIKENRVVNIMIFYDGDSECSPESINMSNKGIDDDTVCLISFGLYNNATVKKLDFSRNKISYSGMNRLSECVEHATSLEHVDLSGNCSFPWGVYCAIIRHCSVKSLTVFGDEGMKHYVKKIADNLLRNSTLQTLILHMSRSTEGIHVDTIITLNCDGKLLPHAHSKGVKFGEDRIVNIKICYCGDYKSSPKSIKLSNRKIDDTVCSILFELCNNTIKKKLDLSYNSINQTEMNRLSECFKHAIPLEYVDLNGNNSSPWGVYCAIIRHCSVDSLTLCGDEEMKEYVREITDSLQTNVKLQSLTLCKIGQNGLQSIKDVLRSITTLKELNMSWKREETKIIHRQSISREFNTTSSHEGVVNINILYDGDHEYSPEVIDMSNTGIDDDAVCLISFGLHNNTTVQKLDLSCNSVTDYGAVAISDCLRNNFYLRTLILSGNVISFKGAEKISELIIVNKVIHKIDISCNCICDEGAKAISECLKTNNTLQELNLSDNWITSKGVKKVAEAIRVNKGLLKLDISKNDICDKGVMYISDNLKCNDVLLELNLSSSGMTNEAVKFITEAIQQNVTLRKINLSHNHLWDDGTIRDIIKHNDTLKELNL